MNRALMGLGALVVTLGGCLACGYGIGKRGTVKPAASVPTPPDADDLKGFAYPRFAVIGDFGVDSDDEADVAALVHSWDPDFIVTLGDNNYPVGSSLSIDENIGKYYARFMGHYAGDYGPGADVNRFFPSPGNHDWYSPERLNPYTRYFHLPGNERYYDLRIGPIHLFALDSDGHEPDGNTPDSSQARWLEPRLRASDACLKLVYFHHPAYSSSSHGNALNMRWPFAAWGATAVMSGHDHAYERLDIGGTPYFVNGLGGAPTYEFAEVQPESRVRFNAAHGAMLVRVHPDGVEYQFRDTQNRLVDRHFTPMSCAQASLGRAQPPAQYAPP